MAQSLGEKIKKLRLEHNFSLEGLAELTDTSKSYLWEIENRSSHNLSYEKLTKIAQALGVTTDYLTLDDSELSNEILEKALFRKFGKLPEDDKKKIAQIIELWSKNE